MVNEILTLFHDLLSAEGDLQAWFDQILGAWPNSGMTDEAFRLVPATENETPQVSAQFTYFSLQLEFEFVVEQTEVQESDPITLDLDGDGVELTPYHEGAYFDIEGRGVPVHTAFVTGGDAFLAIDRNGNDTIDSGAELFGDQNGAVNGFEELRTLDSNRDGRIDAQDEAYTSLLLFKDNGNGVTEEGELVSLAQAGIREISLAYEQVDLEASGGNRIAQIAYYRNSDGSEGVAADSVLRFLA